MGSENLCAQRGAKERIGLSSARTEGWEGEDFRRGFSEKAHLRLAAPPREAQRSRPGPRQEGQDQRAYPHGRVHKPRTPLRGGGAREGGSSLSAESLGSRSYLRPLRSYVGTLVAGGADSASLESQRRGEGRTDVREARLQASPRLASHTGTRDEVTRARVGAPKRSVWQP